MQSLLYDLGLSNLHIREQGMCQSPSFARLAIALTRLSSFRTAWNPSISPPPPRIMIPQIRGGFPSRPRKHFPRLFALRPDKAGSYHLA